MEKIKYIWMWFLSFIFFCFALALLPSLSCLLFAIALAICLPLPTIQGFWHERGLRGAAKNALLVALFIAGCCFAPSPSAEQKEPTQQDAPTDATETVDIQQTNDSVGNVQSDGEPQSEVELEPVETVGKSETVALEPEAQPEATPEPMPEPESEATPESTPEPEPEMTPEPTPEPELETTPESTPESEAGTTPEPMAEPEPEAEPTPEAEKGYSYDVLQTIFMNISVDTTMEELENMIDEYSVYFTKKEYNSSDRNERKQVTYKIALTANSALQRYADSGDHLEVSFGTTSETIRHANYNKSTNIHYTALFYNSGYWFDFRGRPGYYICYASGTYNKYTQYDSAEELIQIIIDKASETD